MLRNPEQKYRPFDPGFDLTDRRWPSHKITQAPRWCSTDMRDGNQALIDPMNAEKKRRFYDLLVKAGFKEIEVAFPSASQTDFDFVRQLIEQDLIPDDVLIQVLTQSRADLIERTFESLRGAKQAVVHLYNATAPLFRRVVFQKSPAEIIEIAVSGARAMREAGLKQPETDWFFEYSPETFCFTEPDFALEICARVLDVFAPTPDHKLILNLPATVEVATPNVYADQIEYFCRHISRRDAVTISVHPHNDRGTGVACAELAVLAGAERVEGCLFGNGERTGNVDLVTLALNLYTQGIDPGIYFDDIHDVVQTVEYCNQLPVHPRHPYAGELVFTAFSGSHQDAIKKGFAAQATRNDDLWEIPYLPIDPADLGCSYEAVIRVNSQSGKGGIAWVLQQDHGLNLPRKLQIDFSRVVQELADTLGHEITAADIWAAFQETYHLVGQQRLGLIDYTDGGSRRLKDKRQFIGRIAIDGASVAVTGQGNGLISAVAAALQEHCGIALEVVDYQEHAITKGSDTGNAAKAAAYVECRLPDGGQVFGVGIDHDVATASVKAMLSAANGVSLEVTSARVS